MSNITTTIDIDEPEAHRAGNQQCSAKLISNDAKTVCFAAINYLQIVLYLFYERNSVIHNTPIAHIVKLQRNARCVLDGQV